MRGQYRLFVIVACAALFAGCSSTPAPVEDLSAGTSARGQALTKEGIYHVRRGDTLYSIAFNYGLDWKDVARWNNVHRPYTIWPGQELRLAPPSARSTGDGEIVTRAMGKTPRATTRPADIPEPATSQTTPAPAEAPATESPAQTTPTIEPQATTSEPPSTVASSTPQPRPAATPPRGPLSNPSSWLWPTEGRVVGRFSAADPARKGIDISGEEGQDIVASATGDVVYSGNGLIGFGELIIIKHSDSMLTAYAHNRVRLVQEGERVSAGSKIAEMGRNGQDQTQLHFELRVDGKPVDPLRYLPSR